MNWIQKNKFLTGYLIVLVVGLIGLGYFLYVNWNQSAAVSDQYAHQVAELQRLETLPAYPNRDNLEKLKAQSAAFETQVQALRDKVAAMQFPLESVTPAEFQERLHKAEVDLGQTAQQNGVEIGSKFYFGFDVYNDHLSTVEQAPLLARQLQAIQFVISDLVASKVTALTGIKRQSLPEESEASTRGGGRGGSVANRGRGAREAGAATRSRFQVQFTTDQAAFRKVLNDISGSNKQFFVVRSVAVTNEKQTGPEHTDLPQSTPTPTPEPSPSPSVAANSQTTSATNSQAANGQPAEQIKPILGTEKLNVTLLVEIIDFASDAKK